MDRGVTEGHPYRRFIRRGYATSQENDAVAWEIERAWANEAR